jgi:hypothetical protein
MIARTGTNDDSSGDLNLTNTMTIDGAGTSDTIIDADQIDRVFAVAEGTTVAISSVTISNGQLTDVGGGIVNRVAVNDLINLVNIALGNAAPSARANDIPAGATIDVALLVRAVSNALSGCH